MNNIKKITHATFKCGNFYEEMVFFYNKTLGLELLFVLNYSDEGLIERMGQKGLFKPGDPWITYIKIKDREFIELFNHHYEEQYAYGDYSFSCLHFSVKSLPEAIKDLVGKGAALYSDDACTVNLDGTGSPDCFYIKDPKNNVIKFSEEVI